MVLIFLITFNGNILFIVLMPLPSSVLLLWDTRLSTELHLFLFNQQSNNILLFWFSRHG